MKNLPQSQVTPGHPDYDICRELAEKIERRAGGHAALASEIPLLIRRAIDEVIDTPRTGRLSLSDTEKTEKTYIGTKIEILVRDFLGLPKGKLDLNIDGHDVDIKNTVGNNWMIPTEAVGKPCILIASNESTFLCYLGIIIAKLEYLTTGANKDAKRSVSAEGKKNVYWLLRETPYPVNFWSSIDKDTALHITDGSVGGTERLKRLFRSITRAPISRDIVQGIARQHDYMKRLRKNGGARDPLAAEGIALLSGKYHSTLIDELGIPTCSKEEFISIKPITNREEHLLREGGHIL